MAKIYDDDVLFRVIDSLVSANTLLNNANQALESGYRNLNGEIKSATNQVTIKDIQGEIDDGKTFMEDMQELVSDVENNDIEGVEPFSIDATLSLASLLGMDTGEQNYDDIIAGLKKMSIEQILTLFEQFNLSNEEEIKLKKWINEENADAVFFLILKCQKDSEIKQKTTKQKEIDNQISTLEGYFSTIGKGESSIDIGLEYIKKFLNDNKDNQSAIIGKTFTIAGEIISFGSYEEGVEFVNNFKEEKRKELNDLKEQSANLKQEIKILNKTIGQIDANLVFYDNFTYAYKEVGVKDSSFDEFLGYSKENGYDLKNCSINDALMVLNLFYSENDNEDKDLNLFSFLDYIRENNEDYKDMSDEKFAQEVNIARSDFATWIGSNNKLKDINNNLYKMMDIDYFYMNEEEKKAYEVIFAKEGKERADYYLEVIEERSLNARKGMEEGYKSFKDIVSSPGKLMELGQAFLEGGWSGLASYCDHIYSVATGDYKMTVNDYASQMVQQLFQTMILSYKAVDHSTIDEFEREYGLDAVTANNLKKIITERAYKGEEGLRYYELLGYISPDKGGLTSDEVKEYEEMFNSIDGGEFYTKYVLKSAYSAGVSTGNMLPSIAIGMIPTIGPYLAKLSFWTSAAGGTYREQRRNGALWTEAMLAGAIDGALEVGTEYFVGGIPFLSKNDVGIGRFLEMPFAQKVLFMGKEILGEESEEIIQLFGGNYLLSKVSGDTYKLSDKFDQLPETIISTFMSTLALNSLTYGTQTAFLYGDAMINLTPNDWANLYNEGFNALNFKKLLDNKVSLNLNNQENIEVLDLETTSNSNENNVVSLEGDKITTNITSDDDMYEALGKYLNIGDTENYTLTDSDKAIISKHSESEIIDGICDYLNKVCTDSKTTIEYITKLSKLQFPNDSIKNSLFSKIQKQVPISNSAKYEFTDIDSINKTLENSSTNIDNEVINKIIVNSINDYIEKNNLSNEDCYYFMLNLSGLDFLNSHSKTELITNIINKNKQVRQGIILNAKNEIDYMLDSLFNIKDDNVSKAILDDILSDNFEDSGVSLNPNWDNFITLIEPYVKKKLQDLVKNKDPILFGKIDDEFHSVMNETFATVEDTTIGEGLYFLDLVYQNWDEQSSVSPKLENLWSMISQVYVDSLCEAINPNTNERYETVKFVCPDNLDISSCFGNIFQVTELPAILKNGTIKNIEVNMVDSGTMKTNKSFVVNIEPLIEKYQNANSSNNSHFNKIIFNDFLNLVKDEYTTKYGNI